MATTSAPVSTRRAVRPALVLVAAVAVAVAGNAIVATVAVAAGAPASYGPLTFPAYTLMTVIGMIAGWAGWTLVIRRTRDPRRVLTWLVPLVAVLSFVPDALLLALGFIPGTTLVAVVALMAMHVVVLAAAVPAFAIAARARTMTS
jgi:hypothetical protein